MLGVATAWDKNKGLDARYAVVLVGLEPRQLHTLPANILGIARTNDVKELAALYTAADVFVNPSTEETFSLTTAEAIACGTPALVYADTACAELVGPGQGQVVPQDVQALYRAILQATAAE